MSDLSNAEEFLLNRIKELEQKLSEFKQEVIDLDKEDNKGLVSLQGKIEALEKDFKDNAVYTTKNEYEGIKKEISELRKSLDAWIDGSRITNKQLTGLKERLEVNEIAKLPVVISLIQKHNELLQEHIKEHLRVFTENTKDEIYPIDQLWQDHLEAMLKKLEGEKDRIGENLQVQNRKPNGDSNSKPETSITYCKCGHSYLQHHAGSCAICDCLSFTKVDSKPSLTKAEQTIYDEVVRRTEALEPHTGYSDRAIVLPAYISFDSHEDIVKFNNEYKVVRKKDLKELFKYTEPIKGHEEWYMGIKEKYLSEEEHDEE